MDTFGNAIYLLGIIFFSLVIPVILLALFECLAFRNLFPTLALHWQHVHRSMTITVGLRVNLVAFSGLFNAGWCLYKLIIVCDQFGERLPDGQFTKKGLHKEFGSEKEGLLVFLASSRHFRRAAKAWDDQDRCTSPVFLGRWLETEDRFHHR